VGALWAKQQGGTSFNEEGGEKNGKKGKTTRLVTKDEKKKTA